MTQLLAAAFVNMTQEQRGLWAIELGYSRASATDDMWGEPAFEGLIGLLDHPEERVRIDAADCLLAAPADWLWSHRDGISLTRGPSTLVLKVLDFLMSTALINQGVQPEVEARLLEALQHPNAVVRARVMQTITYTPPPGIAGRASAQLRTLLVAPEPQVRLSTLCSLHSLGGLNDEDLRLALNTLPLCAIDDRWELEAILRAGYVDLLARFRSDAQLGPAARRLLEGYTPGT